ncbi:hypothetical protein [Sphingobacterium anhuiense]|uniref:hypothetical protein n=1 Tax=Sphingobacterium anhuiense TaxID=493780 RepID=UPI003C2E667B
MQNFNSPNEVGDSYGALNTLFSGFAFAGIIISIFSQNQELKLQRKELRLQRREIKLNREELIENRKELSIQSSQMQRQAENLKISAKLSALTALLNYYLEVQGRSENPLMFEGKIKRTVNEIETINNLKTL